jgi:hypothetical protein
VDYACAIHAAGETSVAQPRKVAHRFSGVSICCAQSRSKSLTSFAVEKRFAFGEFIAFVGPKETNHCAAGAARTAKLARRAEGRMPEVKKGSSPDTANVPTDKLRGFSDWAQQSVFRRCLPK